MQYLILVIVYNQKLSESLTIQSLIYSKNELQGSRLIVWDNSKVQQDTSEKQNLFSNFSEINIDYIHTPENLSLSQIYNNVRKSKKYSYEYIILMDQDTVFNQSLFQVHKEAINTYGKFNLYLPIIKYKSKIISPAYLYYFKGFYFQKEIKGVVLSKFKTAINSCMIINYDYFVNKFNGYDERLRFYGTDDYFMHSYAKDNKYFVILDYIVEHDLSYSFLNPNLKQVLSRYQEANRALLINNENNLFISIFLRFYLKIRGLYLSIKFSEKGFLNDI